MNLDAYPLSTAERESLAPLLARLPAETVGVEQIWQLMDQVWEEMGCSQRQPDPVRLEAYYRHPVWLLNGLFIEQDAESMGHRHAIAAWVRAQDCATVLDFGGGFGTLARCIAAVTEARIDVCEPHPSQCALRLSEPWRTVAYVDAPRPPYDCVISTDVIEHLPQPLAYLQALVENLAGGGHLLLAPCFEPVIRCHLPSTFHLKHTLGLFTRLLGLHFLGFCRGSHALVFRRQRGILAFPGLFRVLEWASRALFPVFEWRARQRP